MDGVLDGLILSYCVGEFDGTKVGGSGEILVGIWEGMIDGILEEKVGEDDGLRLG